MPNTVLDFGDNSGAKDRPYPHGVYLHGRRDNNEVKTMCGKISYSKCCWKTWNSEKLEKDWIVLFIVCILTN